VSESRVDVALDDAELGKLVERFQARPPHTVLECGFRDDGDPAGEQQP
jgi:hypothetical protein